MARGLAFVHPTLSNHPKLALYFVILVGFEIPRFPSWRLEWRKYVCKGKKRERVGFETGRFKTPTTSSSRFFRVGIRTILH
eukprot:502814-Amorphochlora_amoeboformis.AAC.1